MTRHALVSTLAVVVALGLAVPAVAGKPLAPMLPLKPDAARLAKQKNAAFNKMMRGGHVKLRVHKTARQWLSWRNPVPTQANVRIPVYPGAKLLSWQYGGPKHLSQLGLITPAAPKTVYRWYETHLKGWNCAVNTLRCHPKGDNGGFMGSDGVHVSLYGRKNYTGVPQGQQGLLVAPKDWQTVIRIQYRYRGPTPAWARPPKGAHHHHG